MEGGAACPFVPTQLRKNARQHLMGHNDANV